MAIKNVLFIAIFICILYIRSMKLNVEMLEGIWNF
nr:MAG TPA: hypothetical protein [Caudoviricetes sp.]DAO55645.1 MAG TPA: hypothetical protein [Caudoviricetes sp.]